MSEHIRALEVINEPVKIHHEWVYMEPWVVRHCYAVGEYARELGEVVGLPRKTLNDLEVAGTLHDIWKIYVPEMILNKPARLTREEGQLMAKHPLEGAKMVRSRRFGVHVAQLVEGHHEAWDGSGYPKGLSGKFRQISLIQSILSASDIFHSLLDPENERPYKRPWTLSASRTYLLNMVGTKLHPDLEYPLLDWYADKFKPVPHAGIKQLSTLLATERRLA